MNYTGDSFWAQADSKSMKELFYHTNFKSLYKVRPNFLTIISFFAREMYLFFFVVIIFHYITFHTNRLHCYSTVKKNCQKKPKRKQKKKNKIKTKPKAQKKKLILY